MHRIGPRSFSLRTLLPAIFAVLWAALFVWLWIGAPVFGRFVGSIWFLLGLLAAGNPFATIFYLCLGIALAWFGNNPGGAHHLYLLEMALMGLNTRYWWDRTRGSIIPLPGRGDAWLNWFVAYSMLAVLPQWRFLWVEIAFAPRTAFYTIMNHYGTSPNFGGQMGLKLLLAWGLYLDLRDRPWSFPALVRQWRIMLTMLLLSAVIGMLNYYRLFPLAWWREENPDVLRFGFRRLQSLYWHPGWYAQYLIALAPAALAWAWLARTRNTRLGWVAAALFITLVVFLTQQRAGWLGLAGGFGFIAFFAHPPQQVDAPRVLIPVRFRNLLWTAAILALLAALLAFLIPSFRARLAQLGAYENRFDIWRASVKIISNYPWTGAGFGNYFTTHTRLFNWDHPFFQMHDKVGAHNMWLYIWAERGLLGVIFFTAFLIQLFRRVMRGLHASDPHQRWLWLALGGALAALCINGLFQEVLYVRTVELLFWMIAGWTTLAPETKNSTLLFGQRARRLGGPLILILMLTGILHAQWSWIGPLEFHFMGGNCRVHGREYRTRVNSAEPIYLTLACVSPTVSPQNPVIFTVTFSNRQIRHYVFEHEDFKNMLFDPQGKPGEIVVTSSQVWSPMAWGLRSLPVTEFGVLTIGPTPLSTVRRIEKEFNFKLRED